MLGSFLAPPVLKQLFSKLVHLDSLVAGITLQDLGVDRELKQNCLTLTTEKIPVVDVGTSSKSILFSLRVSWDLASRSLLMIAMFRINMLKRGRTLMTPMLITVEVIQRS